MAFMVLSVFSVLNIYMYISVIVQCNDKKQQSHLHRRLSSASGCIDRAISQGGWYDKLLGALL